jgi:hypothetical protein
MNAWRLGVQRALAQLSGQRARNTIYVCGFGFVGFGQKRKTYIIV